MGNRVAHGRRLPSGQRQQRQQGSARCGPGPGRPHATHTSALLPLAGPLAVPFCEASVRLSHFLAHWLPVTCRGPYVGRPSASCAVRPGWPASSLPGDLVWGTEVPRCHASRTACLLLCDRPPWPVYAPPRPPGAAPPTSSHDTRCSSHRSRRGCRVGCPSSRIKTQTEAGGMRLNETRFHPECHVDT